MKKQFLNRITTSLLAIVFVLIALPSGKADAQYCGYDNAPYRYNYAIIKRVTLRDVTEGNDVYIRNSDWEGNGWATTDLTGTTNAPIEMNIGNNYEITVNWGLYYQGYLRVYIDRNNDGRWETLQIGPDKEFVGYIFRTDYNYYIPPNVYQDDKLLINIGDDVPEGPSRLRVSVNYYYYSPDPCINYYASYIVGEVEDYNVNFVASLPEIYPATGNILYNNEKYDGTTRNFNGVPTAFKLPGVEFKGAQPANTKIEYKISGPLPSKEVVYTALDPNTGLSSINFTTPTQIYNIKSATGAASVSTSEGTFKPSKGGEYVVNVKVTKTNGKSSEGAQVFTVANNYDISLASIESPRTNRYPRFFKYLRSTNISVACKVQNTGLNPIKRFEVTAKIYNATTNALVGNQPKIVFDSDNDPNLEPLQSGEKYEANFAAFQTPFTGEYYIVFDVAYAYDEEAYNNSYPRPDGEKHYFEIQYNDQLTAGDFDAPLTGQVLKVNRPNAPKVVFLNNGISDASNINFHMVVKDTKGKEVYNEVSFLEDMPQGRYNEKLVTFPNMTLKEPGTYTACAWVDYPYDSKHDDDTTCVTFDVELGIQDTITVGDLGGIINQIYNDGEMNSVNDDIASQRIETSVVNFNFNGFSVNPASTTTEIRFNSEDALTLEVVDMNGKVVFSDIAKGNLYNLNVSNLANGAYTVLLRGAISIQSRQLSVVR